MRSLNKVQLIGRLGRDPEVREVSDGVAKAVFTLATNEWAKDGEQFREHTEWHRIVAWGKLARVCGDHAKKGRLVYVEGRIRSREYEDRQKQRRTVTEIHLGAILFLDAREPEGNALRDALTAAAREAAVFAGDEEGSNVIPMHAGASA